MMTPLFHLVILTSASLLPFISASSKCELTTLNRERPVLQCIQRTLQSQVDASERDIEKAVVLNLTCSDLFFHESQLKGGHFGQLPNLEVLNIKFCKIRRIPPRAFDGLFNLKTLSIQSHNADWSSIFMEMEVDSLKNIANVQDLILAHNNIWSLPSGFMCGLPIIKQLNLSSNHVLEVSNIGLSSDNPACKVGLTDLDLSRNFISTLNGQDLSQAPKLKRIFLSRNRLTILADDSFTNLPDLVEIDLSDNQLAALPPRVFNSTHHLQKLSLQNNSLSLITSELFVGLVQLKYLNLSRNLISSHLVSSETFASLSGLEILDLSFNKFTKIDHSIFSKLTSLKEVFLHNNLIHRIEPNAFGSSDKLTTLDLSFNNLASLLGLLKKEQKIKVLRLGNNKVVDNTNFSLPCEELLDLDLQENLLTSVPIFLTECSKLTTLDLSNNKITELPDGTFVGLSKLFGLSLAGNQIKSLSNNSFANMTSGLNILNLANNKLEEIDGGAFWSLKELRALRLDNNSLNDINGLVSHMSHLHWLNISSNNLEWFDYAFIPNSLTWLDVSHNIINDLGNFYGLTNFALQTLIASHNLIHLLNPESLLPSLVHVKLNNNHISRLEPNTLSRLSDLQVADLQSNQISHLRSEEIAISSKNIYGKGKVLIFFCKKIACSFHMQSIMKKFSQSLK